MRHFSLLIGSGLILAAGAAAQDNGLGAPISDPGLWGGQTVWDVQTAGTAGAGYTTNGCLGVAFNANTNECYVSTRRQAVGSPHNILVFDNTGTCTAVVPQHANQNGSAWGGRDMASDDNWSGTPMFYVGGDGTDLYTFDGTTITGVKTLVGYGGGTVRGLAICQDVAGLNTATPGAPICVTTSWSNPVDVYDTVTGASLYQFPSAQLYTYGIGWDPMRNTLMFHGQGGATAHPSTTNVGSVMSETDMQGNPTGVAYLGNLSLTSGPPNRGGVAGGLSSYTDATGRLRSVVLTQATADSVLLVDGSAQYGNACGGGDISHQGRAFETQTAFSITMSNYTGAAPTAFMAWGVPSYAGIPIGFVACPLLIDMTTFMDVLGPVTISLGGAQFGPFAIPDNTFGAEAAFQWLIPGATILPLDASQGLSIYVNTK